MFSFESTTSMVIFSFPPPGLKYEVSEPIRGSQLQELLVHEIVLADDFLDLLDYLE